MAQTSGQFAGNANNNLAGEMDYMLGSVNERDTKTKIEHKLQGSAFTSDEFNLTELRYEDEVQGNVFYRYNAYLQEIEIKKMNIQGEGVRSLAKDKKISIMVDGKPMSFKTFIDKNGNTTNGYLIQMTEGKYNLFKRVVVKFTEGQKAQNSFIKAIPARFTQFTEYYFFEEGAKRMDEIELKNRKLLKLVPNSIKDDLKSYLKENGLNIKNPDELEKVFAYLNK